MEIESCKLILVWEVHKRLLRGTPKQTKQKFCLMVGKILESSICSRVRKGVLCSVGEEKVTDSMVVALLAKMLR